MKRFLVAVWCLAFMFMLCLLVNYASNENMIKKYKDEVYEENTFAWLGFTERYIAPYNQGNIYYQKLNYEEAIKSYDEALEKKPPKDKECLIRINKVLAMVAPINEDEIDSEKLEETIKLIKDAKAVLTEKGCATEDGKGHNKDAQTLYDELDDLQKKLEKEQDKQQEDGQSDNNDGDDDKQQKDPADGEDENDKEQQEKMEDAKEKLEKIQQDGAGDRGQEMGQIEYIFDYDYYDGATW